MTDTRKYTKKEIEQIQVNAYAAGVAHVANIAKELGMHFEKQSMKWYEFAEECNNKRDQDARMEICFRYEEKARALQQLLDRTYPGIHHIVFSDHITEEPTLETA